MRLIFAAFIAGELLFLFLSELPTRWTQPVLLSLFFLGILLLLIVEWILSRRHPYLRTFLRVTLLLGLGFVWVWSLSVTRVEQVLHPCLEGQDLLLKGHVNSLPSEKDRSTRFVLRVHQIELPSVLDCPPEAFQHFPDQLALAWHPPWRGHESPPDIIPGQLWQLPVQLKRPHGLMNPYGFDFERWMFANHLGAQGSVKAYAKGLDLSWKPKLEQDFIWSFTSVIEYMRWWLRDRIRNLAPEGAAYVGVLIALVMGEQNAIAQEDWRIFNATGIGHLISISGLHVTMLAGLASGFAKRLWSRGNLPLLCATPRVAALAGLGFALFYTFLAGFQIPAQRTTYMVGVVAYAAWFGRITRAFDIWWWALFLVLLQDPWAVYTPGFWLSFGAVAAILYAMPNVDATSEYGQIKLGTWQKLKDSCRDATRVQAVVTLALIPTTLYWFYQVSLISPLANAVAIPLISYLVTPFAMLGAILPELLARPCLWLAHTVMEWVAWCLKPMANLPGALFYSFAPSLWGMGLSLVGVYFLVAPGRLLSTWRPRAVGMVLLSCICIPADDLIVPGEFRMIVFDIGQGTAVLIETAKHRLLYDTGPKTSPSNNAGERHILPYLRARGIKEIDRLAISHKDTDHVGGALSLMDSIRFADLHGTLPAHHYVLQRAQGLSIPALTCQAGQEWFWDGIRFKVWHPYADMTFNSMHHFGKPNALSCVIEVSNQSFSVWLTGDVERGGEAIISNEYKDSKQLASILLVPHHGSATSSTSHFLDALSPSWAIVQAGYRNRYRHPNTQVMGRYIERDIPVLQTIHTGAQIWHLGKEKGYRTDWREEVRRIWHR